MTSSEDNSGDVQKVSHPVESTTDKDSEDNQNKVLDEADLEVTQPTINQNTGDGKHEAAAESTIDHDSMKDIRGKPETESNVDNDTEDGQSELLLTRSTGNQDRDEATDRDGNKVPDASQVNEEDTSMTNSDWDREATLATVEMPVDDSCTDTMGEEQFLSPAASEPDSTDDGGSLTEEQPPTETDDGANGAVPWSAKVPLLEMEPPAMESDYEEATCEMEEEVLTSQMQQQNDAEPKEESSIASRPDGSDNTAATTHETSAVTSSTTKPKPL